MSGAAAVIGYPLTGIVFGFLWIRLGGLYTEDRESDGDYGKFTVHGTWVGREHDWAPDVSLRWAFWLSLLFWPLVLTFMVIANTVRALAIVVTAITHAAERAYLPRQKQESPIDPILAAAKREVEEIAPDV